MIKLNLLTPYDLTKYLVWLEAQMKTEFQDNQSKN